MYREHVAVAGILLVVFCSTCRCSFPPNFIKDDRRTLRVRLQTILTQRGRCLTKRPSVAQQQRRWSPYPTFFNSLLNFFN
eukprot:gene782-425_t